MPKNKNEDLLYCALKLNGEAGEVAEKLGKLWRKQGGAAELTLSTEDTLALTKELGDCLWYIAAISNIIGINLNEVASINLDKLWDRRARGVIVGAGDNR